MIYVVSPIAGGLEEVRATRNEIERRVVELIAELDEQP
jgi:hypothetical protein